MHPLTLALTTCRRLTVALALLALLPTWASAAKRGPDAAGYTATDETLYSFEDLAGAAGAAGILADTDDGSASLTLPFDFVFYGQTYSQVCVSSNGALYFITDATQCGSLLDFANGDLSSGSTPGDLPALLPFWSDLTFLESGAGSVLYQTIGVTGSRKFVVQWNDSHTGSPSKPITVQLVLLEGTNRILFQYRNVDLGEGNAASKGGAATVGIRNAGGVASGAQIQWSVNAPVLKDELALLFAPPGLLTSHITWADPAAINLGTPLSATQLNAVVDAPGTLTYTPALGELLGSGAHTLSVSFTPSDPNAYTAATANVSITVNVPPSSATVTLLTPTGPRVFIGSPANVTWSATGSPTSFDVQLSRENGPFANVPGCVGLPGAARSCAWTPTQPTTNNARLRVVLHVGAATVSDNSDAPLAIVSFPAIVLTASPLPGEHWAVGAAKTIRWVHTLGAGSKWKIELSRNGGSSWQTLAASVTTNGALLSEWPWAVTGPLTTQARIRVTSLDTPAATFASERFSIETPTIKVVAPNTKITIGVGRNLSIQIDSTALAGETINLQVSRNGGSTWSPIGSVQPTLLNNRSTFSWAVTGPKTTTARIRAVWSVSGAVSDISDVNFVIN